MRLHYIQHVYVENPGSILGWAIERGHEISHTLIYEECFRFPEAIDFDWLIIMGGPMGANDESEYPWIAAEKSLIRDSIALGKAVIGFCLGAQLICSAMGGSVEESEYSEIGWLEITQRSEGANWPLSAFPEKYEAFEWHSDCCSALPSGAVLFAAGEGCKNQAFRIGDLVYGFQFHLESTREMVEYLVEEYSDELGSGKYCQTAEEILALSENIDLSKGRMHAFLDRLAGIGN